MTTSLDGKTMQWAAQLDRVIAKIDRNMASLDADHAPSYTVGGSYTGAPHRLLARDHWTLSFFTGMVAHAFRHTGNADYLRYLHGLQEPYRQKVTVHALDTMHDLGFLYTLSEVALYKLTGDREARGIALAAATELGKRFNVKGRFIDAWSRMDRIKEEEAGLMIVDCLMNLPLLFWASAETGHAFFKEVAEAHADTALRYLIRDDDTARHAYRFDWDSGDPIGERCHGGYGVGSVWARGNAWAIYGFALAYRYSGKAVYLETACRIADFFIGRLPEDGVPVWDFRMPDDAPRLIDTSAAAIAACGFLELAEHEAAAGRERYALQAEKMIASLSEAPYLADASAEHVLESAQCGEEQAGAIWGDYFYMEALMRLNRQAVLFW